MKAVWRREMLSYVYSPLFYGVLAAFFLLGGYFFSVSLAVSRIATLSWYFGDAAVLLIFVAPLLTMRLFAEERARGTDELLFTLPIPAWKVVLGKYLAALAVGALLFSGSIVYLLVLAAVGAPRWGEVIASYVGVILLLATFLAVGSLASALTASPLLAAVGGFAVLLLLWLAGWAADALPGTAGEWMRALAMSSRLEDFLRGVVDTSHVVFFLSIALAALTLTAMALERRAVR